MKQNEHLHQVALFQFLDKQKIKAFAIPNGGMRHYGVARKLKLEGVKAGIPDIFIPIAKKGFNGLFIELKDFKGKVSLNQHSWIESLKQEGYKVEVCYGSGEAIQTVVEYLK